MGELISKLKQDARHYDEHTASNIDRCGQYELHAKQYLNKIADNEQAIRELKTQLQAAQQAEVELLSQMELENFDHAVLKQ